MKLFSLYRVELRRLLFSKTVFVAAVLSILSLPLGNILSTFYGSRVMSDRYILTPVLTGTTVGAILWVIVTIMEADKLHRNGVHINRRHLTACVPVHRENPGNFDDILVCDCPHITGLPSLHCCQDVLLIFSGLLFCQFYDIHVPDMVDRYIVCRCCLPDHMPRRTFCRAVYCVDRCQCQRYHLLRLFHALDQSICDHIL